MVIEQGERVNTILAPLSGKRSSGVVQKEESETGGQRRAKEDAVGDDSNTVLNPA